MCWPRTRAPRSARRSPPLPAFSTLLLTTGLSLGILALPGGAELYSSLYDRWLGLLTAAQAMALVQAAWVYAYSFRSGELLALGGNSGVFVYDVRVGRGSEGGRGVWR